MSGRLAALLCLLLAPLLVSAQAFLSVTPTTLSGAVQNVTVTWAGIPNPTRSDFIGIYVGTNRQDASFVGYRYLTDCPTWKQGSGKLIFTLVNARTNPWQFRLWSAATPADEDDTAVRDNPIHGNATVIAVSAPVTFASYNQPMQTHLALTADISQMLLMWVTHNATQPVVTYGPAPGHYTGKALATSATYYGSQLCDAPARDPANFLAPGTIHTALMTGLSPNTRYYYRIGDASVSVNDPSAWSDEYSFVSHPGVGANVPVAVLAYGDLGVNPPWPIVVETQAASAKTVKWLQRDLQQWRPEEAENLRPTLTLHIGDISYARGYAYLWELFFSQVQPVASQTPYMVCIGNHEYDYTEQPWKPTWSNYGTDSGGECGVPYNARFHMPGGAPDTRNLWYSFDYGCVHFVFMSSEHDFLLGSEQWAFLDSNLKAVDRARTPWVVFSGHRPLYTSSKLGSAIQLNAYMRENLEPLLLKYKVNMALWGHVHQYERTCGIAGNFTCAPDDSDAPVHVVIGMAGNQYQVPWGNNSTGTGESSQPDWSIFRSMNWGYSRIAANATHLRMQYLGDQRGELHDEVVLVARYR